MMCRRSATEIDICSGMLYRYDLTGDAMICHMFAKPTEPLSGVDWWHWMNSLILISHPPSFKGTSNRASSLIQAPFMDPSVYSQIISRSCTLKNWTYITFISPRSIRSLEYSVCWFHNLLEKPTETLFDVDWLHWVIWRILISYTKKQISSK